MMFRPNYAKKHLASLVPFLKTPSNSKKVDRKKVDRKKVDLLTVNRWFIPLAKLLTYLVKLHT